MVGFINEMLLVVVFVDFDGGFWNVGGDAVPGVDGPI